MRSSLLPALAVLVSAGTACGPPAGDPDGGTGGEPIDPATVPYATEVVDFAPGLNAGYGDDKLPEVVLGPPRGTGPQAASTDVVSLGAGGVIVLAFSPRIITDGPGPDLVVFENPFWPGGDRAQVFAELGEVAVSEDGITWATFPCDPTGAGDGSFPGCAGWTPTERYDALALDPVDPDVTGGDAFDLAEVGLAEARFVRITDLSSDGDAPSAGFDLDAVGLSSYREP